MELRVGRIIERSAANGPGERFVVWTQGCSLACPGCLNRGLWDRDSGTGIEVRELAARAAASGCRGVTLSGGEPLEQSVAVAALLSALDPRLDSVVFTGFTIDEVRADPARAAALDRADMLIAGRFQERLAWNAPPWAGSSNQTALCRTGRVRVKEWPAARVEAHIGPDGGVFVTGFPDDGLMETLRSPSWV
ncbi:MAG: radical SAM protein [Elusimicrobia bacterium]|nr:radical SAM protein [Elusimicrobiota bacterium]